jgi:hypothetical protein
MKLKKNTWRNNKNQINNDQKKEGQNWSNHKPEDTIIFLKVKLEFQGNEREKRGGKKTPPWPN